MPEHQRDQLLDHEYDGIREFDNPTPGWWHVLFFLSIVFSVVYTVFWHTSPAAWTPEEALAAAEMRQTRQRFAEIGTLDADEATLLRMMGDEKWMTFAAGIYRSNCASCHGAKGQGEVGPNLTDDHWINVATLADVHAVVADGANNGAMPGWKSRLHPNEVVLVSAYVASLRGRNEAGRRAEGEPIAPWPAAPAGAAADGAGSPSGG